MEIQIGIDTISFRHNLSFKQKKAIIKEMKGLPKFKNNEHDYEHPSHKYTSDYFAKQGVKLQISRTEENPWELLVIIHPTLVLGEDDRSALYYASKSSYNKIVKTVDKILKQINVSFSLDDMPLYRLDVTVNLIFDDGRLVVEYIRILKKSKILAITRWIGSARRRKRPRIASWRIVIRTSSIANLHPSLLMTRLLSWRWLTIFLMR